MTKISDRNTFTLREERICSDLWFQSIEQSMTARFHELEQKILAMGTYQKGALSLH